MSTSHDLDPGWTRSERRLAALNDLARALAEACDDDAIGALVVRAATAVAGATRAWVWLRAPADPADDLTAHALAGATPPVAGDLVGTPMTGAEGPLGVIWAAGADAATLEAIAHQAARALEVARLRRALATSRREAHTDALTGLWNRRHARAALDREAAVARRLGRPFAVLAIDVDRFKALNDAHGHDAGDRALAHVAARLAATARESDLVARWGGEEFLVLCPATDAEQAEALAERLRRAVAEPSVPIGPDRPHPVTISIGVAAMGPTDHLACDVIRRADRALYAAKAAGRDRVVRDPGTLIQA